jgi:peroxiredoxin
LRQDYAKFQERGAEIIALGPDGPNRFKTYWQENDMPFPGCADIKSKVAERFHQQVNLFKFGRMPAIFVVDPAGRVQYSHYGDSMSDIPANTEILAIIDGFSTETR